MDTNNSNQTSTTNPSTKMNTLLPTTTHLKGMENWDRFKWIIKSMLDGYNLWDNDTDKPNDNCKPYDLLKNIHSDLWDSIQADQENPTAIQIWDFLNSKYSAKTVNSQMAALFNCCNMDIPTNMDEALALHGRN